MRAEVVNTGTELLLGEILNTNFQYLAQKLNASGYDVLYQTTVGDNPQRMREALAVSLQRADLVVVTGGLGPTRGDITAEVVADLLGRSLVLNEAALAVIKKFFTDRNLKMSDNNSKQAMLIEGATILPNAVGTAPGMAMQTADNKIIALLPGPPSEMQQMLTQELLPYLQQRWEDQGIIYSRVLHVQGLGESTVAASLDALILAQTNPTIALYARQGEIVIRITAKAPEQKQAEALIAVVESQVRKILGKAIFGVDDETLPVALGKELLQQKATIALAESCTGGLASSLLTDVPGSSEYLLGSVVSYSNMAKQQVLKVRQEDLEQYGAVSEAVARQMAEGVRRLFGTTIGIGITGIAGPGGGSATKPVGLVYIAVATEKGTLCTKNLFTGTRVNNKLRSAMTAFAMALTQMRKQSQEDI